MTDTSNQSSTQDLIQAGEDLFMTFSGGQVSAKAAANINEAASFVSVGVSLLSRNVTRFDIDAIVSGLTETVNGVNTIAKGLKKKETTATAAVASGASSTNG